MYRWSISSSGAAGAKMAFCFFQGGLVCKQHAAQFAESTLYGASGLCGCGLHRRWAVRQMKICRQPIRCLPFAQLKQLRREIDHISRHQTSEAVVVPLVQLHAGVSVLVKGAGGHTVMGDLHAVMLGGPGYRDAFLDVLVDRDEQVPPCWLLMRAHLFIHSRSRSGLCVRMTVWTATIRKKRRPVQHQPDHQGDIDPGRQAALWIVCGFFFRGCLIVLSVSGCSVAQMQGDVKTNKGSLIANDCSWWLGNRKHRR